MKRTNVVLDEELLEKARRIGGERTYQATITKALEEYVKKRDFWEKYRKLAAEAAKGGFFDPAYLEEKRLKSIGVVHAKAKRMSANEKRVSQPKVRRRGTR